MSITEHDRMHMEYAEENYFMHQNLTQLYDVISSSWKRNVAIPNSSVLPHPFLKNPEDNGMHPPPPIKSYIYWHA